MLSLFPYMSLLLEKKKPIREIVKDSKWQKVRESLVGQWKEKPSWCIKQLKGYLGNISKSSDDQLRIVMNYLTGSAFRMGKIKGEEISKLRSDISKEMKSRKKI